jgi:Mg2+ and Co2+ transporter CorA
MDESNLSPATGSNTPESKEFFKSFPDIGSFTEAIKSTFGFTFDFQPLLELNTDFSQVNSQYLLLDIKDYNNEKPDNLLFLTENIVFICARNTPPLSTFRPFEDVLQRSFGKSTIMTFLILNKIHDNHIQQLESMTTGIRDLETDFDHDKYRALSREFERYSDRLEEFHDLIIGLQERRYKQVETQYISFDYRVLIAESQSLQGRCRRRMSTLKDLRHDHEMQSTEELNHKIVRMNDILKKLTSITVILMLPTLIASHFGMNFAHMPELQVWWVYPAVIIAQLVIMAVFFIIFKKIEWL